jgi:hypothetical protein
MHFMCLSAASLFFQNSNPSHFLHLHALKPCSSLCCTMFIFGESDAYGVASLRLEHLTCVGGLMGRELFAMHVALPGERCALIFLLVIILI